MLLTYAISPEVHSVENLCVLNIQQANPAKNATCINNGVDENEWKIFGSKSCIQLIREIKGTNVIPIADRNKDVKLSQLSEHQKYEEL